MSQDKTFRMDSMRGCKEWQPCADWFLDRRGRKGRRATAENDVESEAWYSSANRGIGRTLDAVGWGLFFIWVGVSFLTDLSWGVGIMGVAAIIFLKQAARRYFGRKLERFWVVVGVFFLLGGIWELYQVQVELAPIILIVVGVALLLSLFRRRRPTDQNRR